MKRLICFTGCLFSGGWYSVNYHLLLLLRTVTAAGGYEVLVYSYEEKPVLTEKDVLENTGCGELEGRVAFYQADTMSPAAWTASMPKADVIFCQHYSFAEILRAVKLCQPQVRIVSWIHSIVQEELLSGSIWDKNDAFPLIDQQNTQVALSDFCVFDSRYDYELGKLDFMHLGKACVIYPLTEMHARDTVCEENSFRIEDVLQTESRGKMENREKPEILFIGRRDYRKGLDSLIPCSFRMFLEHGIKTVLLTDGEGEFVFSSDATEYQFENMVRAGGIKFENWKLDKKAYAGFLAQKRWTAVFPSYYDPFNMAAYDCAALGIPLVVSNRCGICEILEAGNGLAVCNPYDVKSLYEQIYEMCMLPEFSAEYRISCKFPRFEDDIRELFYETVWRD